MFNGERYRLSAATRTGTPKYDAEYNQKYLKGLGFKTRRIRCGKYYYVYARKKKKQSKTKFNTNLLKKSHAP